MVKNPPAMQETWVQYLGWEDPLEEGMATHSNTLARRTPWSEEPGGPQSMGSQRVRHDWEAKHSTEENISDRLRNLPLFLQPKRWLPTECIFHIFNSHLLRRWIMWCLNKTHKLYFIEIYHCLLSQVMMGCKEFMEKGTLHVAIIHTAPTWKHWVRQNSKVCSGAERVLWKWSEFLNSVLGKLIGVSYSYTLKYVWLTTLICVIWTFELVSLVAQMVKHLPAVRESWVWSLGWKDPLKKEMATHSSTLTWKIAWTGEPGRLQPMGSQKT